MGWTQKLTSKENHDEQGTYNAQVVIVQLLGFKNSRIFINKSHWIVASMVEEFSPKVIDVGVVVIITLSTKGKPQNPSPIENAKEISPCIKQS